MPSGVRVISKYHVILGVNFSFDMHVAEYNVLSLLHEIISKEKYVPPEIEETKEKETATLTGIFSTALLYYHRPSLFKLSFHEMVEYLCS
jgi:hypothetical protein